MQKNIPELWDNLWQKTTKQEDIYNLIKEENSVRWQRIEEIVKNRFNNFKNLRVIEVGAGMGTNALLFAKRGAKVTILDYSKEAISISKEFFKKNSCKANFILTDALKLPKKLEGKYNIAMSFGLAEHFKDEKRYKIIKSHFDLINKTGLVLVSVPNKFNLPYRIHKLAAELIGLWRFGEEYPFSRREFVKIGKSLGAKKISFIGDSFFKSFRFINPLLLLGKKRGMKSKIKKEKGSFLDSYFSYALIFIGEKKLQNPPPET